MLLTIYIENITNTNILHPGMTFSIRIAGIEWKHRKLMEAGPSLQNFLPP